MKKMFVAFGIAFAILVSAFVCVNVIGYNANESLKEEIERVEELDDLAVDYANSNFGYDGKVAYAKIVGVVKDPNYAGNRVDVNFFNANGELIGGSSIAASSLYNNAR